jgi:hypothetical protein
MKAALSGDLVFPITCHSRSRDDLPHVPLRVFGRMEQEPHCRRGKLRASHASGFEESGLAGVMELVDRLLDAKIEGGQQRARSARREIRFLLAPQRPELLGRKRLAACVREQAVETACRVADVKSD